MLLWITFLTLWLWVSSPTDTISLIGATIMRVRSKAQRMAKMSPRQIKQMEKKIKMNKAKKRGFNNGPTSEQIARSLHKKIAKQFGKKYGEFIHDGNLHDRKTNYNVVVNADNPKHIDVYVGHIDLEPAAQEFVDATCKHKYKIGVSVARHNFEY